MTGQSQPETDNPQKQEPSKETEHNAQEHPQDVQNAEEPVTVKTAAGEIKIDVDDEIGLSNDELFEGYLNKLFYGDYGQESYSLGLEDSGIGSLNDKEKKLYQKLKTIVTQIADGEQSSTSFTIQMEAGFPVDPGIDVGSMLYKIVKLLLADCPYELYWYNKTVGYKYQYYYGYDSAGNVVLTQITFSFHVASDYSAAGNAYQADSEKVNRAKAAKDNADEIVHQFEGKSDYEKLHGYKNAICDLVDYNYSTADKTQCNPWQMVHVFDKDPSTKVVCEGYSKAFAYLCEQSSFKSSKIKCYLVTGTMGGGGHMWNIVTMDDGKNYVVDVTNCDGTDSIGYPDKLFLAGAKGSAAGGYTITIYKTDILYAYYDDTKALYPASILTLADTNYEQKSAADISIANKAEDDGGYPVSYTYNGKKLAEPSIDNFTIEGADAAADWKLTCSWYQGDLTAADAALSSEHKLAEAPKDAGTYTLAAEVTAEGFETAQARILVAIEQAAVTADMLEVTLPGTDGRVYYNAKPYQAAVSGRDTGIASGLGESRILVKYRKDSGTDDIKEPVEPGTYRVFADIKGGGNFQAGTDIDTGRSFTIALFSTDKEAELSAGTDEDHWAQSVTVTAPEGFFISLSPDGEFAENISWDTEDAVTGDEEHNRRTKICYYLQQKETGYRTGEKAVYAYIDKTAPAFRENEKEGIHIEQEAAPWWQKLLTAVTFGKYQARNVTIQADDALSGIEAYYYYVDDTSDTAAKTADDLDALAGRFQRSEDGRFALDEKQSVVVYAYARDNAGNQSPYISSDGIRYESEKLAFDESNIPVITGTYGMRISDMKLTKEEAVSTSGVHGTWKIAGGQTHRPQAGDAGRYQILFTPDTDAYEPVTAETAVTVQPKPIVITIQDASRMYGEENPEFTCKLAGDSALAEGDTLAGLAMDMKTEAVKDSAPGEYPITGTAGNANYQVTVNGGMLTVTKKPSIGLAGSPQQRRYPFAKGSGGEVHMNIQEKLPHDAGRILSCQASAGGEHPNIVQGVGVSDDNVLIYQVPAASQAEAGRSAVITVAIETENYETLEYQVTIVLTAKRQAVLSGSIVLEKDSLQYGEPLSELAFAAAEFVDEETNQPVAGELAFAEPQRKPEAGTCHAAWIFRPKDPALYDEAAGTIAVTVMRREITVSNQSYRTDYAFTGSAVPKPEPAQFAVEGIIDGWDSPEYIFTWYAGAAADESQKLDACPSAEGTYLLKAQIKESANYTGAETEVTVTIAGVSSPDAVLGRENEGRGGWHHGAVSITPPQGYQISTDAESWQAALTVTAEHRGAFHYYLRNKETLQISEKKEAVVNIDTTAPAGLVRVSEKIWQSFLETITFGFYTGREEVIEIEASDADSGMEDGDIRYLITNQKYEGGAGKTALAQLPDSDWTPYADGAKITKNKTNIIYVKLTDLAGNTSYLSTNEILHDDMPPVITLTADGTAYADTIGSTDAYDQDGVVYTVRAEDNHAGFKSLKIRLDGEDEQDIENGAGLRVISPGVHILEVTAEDKAGNKAVQREEFRIYADFMLALSGGPSVYDGMPLEPGIDIILQTADSCGEVRYSYSETEDGERLSGLPADAGEYWIHADVAEDTKNGYRAQHTAVPYIIKPAEIKAVPQTLHAAGHSAREYTFDVSSMLPDGVLGTTAYSLGELADNGMFSNTPVLEGSMLKIPVADVSSKDAPEAFIEICFANPNYRIESARLTLKVSDKIPVRLTGAVFPESGSYNGRPFAWSGTPQWITADGDAPVRVSGMDVLYESTDAAGYASPQAPSAAGAYRLTIRVNDNDPDYIGSASAEFVIQKKQVTVTAADKYIYAGEPVPSLAEPKEGTDYTIEGVVDGESLSGFVQMEYLDAESGAAVSADSTAPGTYQIGISGLSGSSYDIRYAQGRLVITAKYLITVNNGTSDKAEAGAGERVVITAQPAPEGREFDSWVTPDGLEFEDAGKMVTAFIMPAKAVQMTASYKEKPADSGNGFHNFSGGFDSRPNTSGSSAPSAGTDSGSVLTPPDGSKNETVNSNNTDGTKKETVTETYADGTKKETVTETYADGTKKETVTETRADGTVLTTVRTTETASDGTVIARTKKQQTDAAGTVRQTTEQAAFTDSRAEVVVTTVSGGSGEAVKTTAELAMKGAASASGSTLNLSGLLADKIARTAGTDAFKMKITVRDSDDKVLYKLIVDKKDMTAGNPLYLYKYNSSAKTYSMVNAKIYRVSSTKGISVRVRPGSNYILLNKTQMTRISKKILKNVKLADTGRTVKKGKTFQVRLDSRTDTDSIEKMIYTTSDKKTASVSRNGKVKAAAVGTAKIKVKAVMKNGTVKTLTMKVKVKKA